MGSAPDAPRRLTRDGLRRARPVERFEVGQGRGFAAAIARIARTVLATWPLEGRAGGASLAYQPEDFGRTVRPEGAPVGLAHAWPSGPGTFPGTGRPIDSGAGHGPSLSTC